VPTRATHVASATMEMTMSISDARSQMLAELAHGPARRGYGIAYDLLGNRAEAEEAVQEALVRACENISDLRDPGAAPAWFLRIVTTMCLRTLRRRKLRRLVFGERASTDDREAPRAEPTDVASLMHGTEAAPPDSELAGRQELAALMSRLDALSAQQRTALVLRYGHNLGVPDIAQLLGVEMATAKTHLVRGLAKLRDLMEEHR
jgi:RNA polymerase sigma-70 factor, ECF subfamily